MANKTSPKNMKSAWQNFEQTGSITDYLSYKQVLMSQAVENSREELSNNADYHKWDCNPRKNAE